MQLEIITSGGAALISLVIFIDCGGYGKNNACLSSKKIKIKSNACLSYKKFRAYEKTQFLIKKK